MLKTCILLVVFAPSESSRRAIKLHEKGHFARDFEKGGGYEHLCSSVPTSMQRRFSYHLHSVLVELQTPQPFKLCPIGFQQYHSKLIETASKQRKP